MTYLEEDVSPIEAAARRAFGNNTSAILVEICRGKDSSGLEVWQEAGAIVIDNSPKHVRGSHHGAFLYRDDYNGPALSPSLDPAIQKLWPMTKGSNTNVRSQNDMHPVFVQSLPDAWGTTVLEAHIPEYASSDASARLAILASMTQCRVGALRFNYGDASLEQSVTGLEALETMNNAVNRFLSGSAKTFLNQTQYWSIYSAGGAQPKVAFKFSTEDPDEWIAKFSLQEFGAYDQPRVERACMLVAEDAKITTPVNRLIVADESGRTIFLSRRYDLYDGTRLHRINAAVALDRAGKYEYAQYTDLAQVVSSLSTNPTADLDQLFRRMLLNGYVRNTDDHLGQFEFVMQPGGGYRLAPAYDINIDDATEPGPHQTRFAGGEDCPEYSVEWIERQAEAMGLTHQAGLEAARDVLAAVARAPEQFDKVRLSVGDKARVMPSLRLGEVNSLIESVNERLQNDPLQQQVRRKMGR